MTDIFKRHSRSLTSPPEHALAIEPDDAAVLPQVPRALYVGTGGDLAVRMVGGETVTLVGVPAGTLLPLRVVRVLASGTSAGDILGFW
jgi:hypothetical protein